MSEKKGLPSLLERHWAESALAIGAVIIAAVSLWVAFDSERTNRELVASASWPFVQFSNTAPAGAQPPVLTFLVSNVGIGPAKLESFELFWQGRPQHSPRQLLQTCCAKGGTALPQEIPGLDTASDQGIVLPAGESVPILSLTRSADNPALWDALASQFTGNLSVRYCYCSALNDCWVNTARVGWPRDLNPRRVRSCPRPTVAYDNTSDRGGSFTSAARER
ncbi:MAG: hypothetical protein ACYDAE_12300 [Steroidobacteraceae bacterium]